MLNQLEYGAAAYEVTADDIAAFLYRLADYRQRLQDYPREGNHKIQQFLDSLLQDECAKIRRFSHER